VHVRIDQARHEKTALTIDHLRIYACDKINSYLRDFPIANRNDAGTGRFGCNCSP